MFNFSRYNKEELGKLPGVTTVTNFGSDKSFIKKWQDKVGKAEADRLLKHAVDRGNVLDKMLDDYFTNNITDTNTFIKNYDYSQFDYLTESIDTGKRLFTQMVDSGTFKDYKTLIGLQSPLWYYDNNLKIGYQGYLDFSYINTKKQIVICDFKGSTKLKRKDWIEDYFMQVSAYSVAFYQRFGVFPLANIRISIDDYDNKFNPQKMKFQEFHLSKSDIVKHFSKFKEYLIKYFNDEK